MQTDVDFDWQQCSPEIARIWREEANIGRIWLWGTIDLELSLNTLIYLTRYNEDENTKAITIYINSRGGTVEHTFALVDQIKSMQTRVTTIVHGVALSAGCIVAASGDRRLALPHARFLFHGVNQPIMSQRSKEILIDANEVLTIDDMLCEYMARVTKKKKSFWRSITRCSNDKWFGVKEALEWGIIDDVCGKI